MNCYRGIPLEKKDVIYSNISLALSVIWKVKTMIEIKEWDKIVKLSKRFIDNEKTENP